MASSNYRPTIGLEIHAELTTATKMFCRSKNDPDEAHPNVNICPVCMAHPGTLPTINREAVRHVLRMGIAIGGSVTEHTEFDRKNYFYPDLPKGYQISQYEHPLVSGGTLAGVPITRIHLEEDTARSQHSAETGESLIDFNRAGIPLMELVTEPTITSAAHATHVARELQLILRELGASDANMEKGRMRVEANISVSRDESLGTKVEVKNLNSFRSVERAIKYEIERQSKILASGGRIAQETRGWNEERQETFSQREKEDSHDYRYFVDPDLPSLRLSDIKEFSRTALEASLPELPEARRARYRSYGVREGEIEVLVPPGEFRRFFDDTIRGRENDRRFVLTAVNYLASDIAGLEGTFPHPVLEKISNDHFTQLIEMIHRGEVSSHGAKNILREMARGGEAPENLLESLGLMQESDEKKLTEIVRKVMIANEKVATEYRKGKDEVLHFLIGQALKESRGAANPTVLHMIFERLRQNT